MADHALPADVLQGETHAFEAAQRAAHAAAGTAAMAAATALNSSSLGLAAAAASPAPAPAAAAVAAQLDVGGRVQLLAFCGFEVRLGRPRGMLAPAAARPLHVGRFSRRQGRWHTKDTHNTPPGADRPLLAEHDGAARALRARGAALHDHQHLQDPAQRLCVHHPVEGERGAALRQGLCYRRRCTCFNGSAPHTTSCPLLGPSFALHRTPAQPTNAHKARTAHARKPLNHRSATSPWASSLRSAASSSSRQPSRRRASPP